MAKGKLILICKCGGEFVTHENGCMSYNGGKFCAENVTYETQFNDLKLNLAKTFDLDQKTVSIKYFLPGKKGFLITVKNNKSVKRMIDFHEDALTAEIFVTGVRSFYHSALQTHANREGDIKKDANTVKEFGQNSPPPIVSLPCNDSAMTKSQGIIEEKVSNLKRKRGQSDQELDLFHRNDSEFIHPSPLAINDDDISPEDLVSRWKSAITGVSQEFKNIYAFQDALQKYAIANRFVYKLNKNDTTDVIGGCAAEGCSWNFHTMWVPLTRSFKIMTLNKAHTCDTKSRKSNNWLLSAIKERLQDSPHLKPKEIANRLLQDFGVELYDSQIWWGISERHGSHKDSYNKLPWFCEKITEMNPGSILKLVVGEKKQFRSLFVSFNATLYGFQNSRPVLFLEATCLKSTYGEVLLTANAINGNDGFFLVAFGIVDFEDHKSWGWFIQQLKAANLNTKPITFVFDREKNLKKTIVEIFEDSYVGYSIFHLLESFKRNMRGQLNGEEKSLLPIHLLSAAQAARPVCFRKVMDHIRRISPCCWWVMQIEPEYWATSSFKGEHYNYITENVGESYVKLMEDSRELPILQKINALIHMMIDNINAANIELSMWSTHLTSSKEKQLEEEKIKSHGLKVLISSDSLFEVRDDSNHSVNISNWSCTCLGWKETGLPCRHALAVFTLIGKNPYDFCSHYFTVNAYQLTYSDSIKPVPIDGPPNSLLVVGNREKEAKKKEGDEGDIEMEDSSKNIRGGTRGGENEELEKVKGKKEEAGKEDGDKGKITEEHEDPSVYVLLPIPTKQPPLRCLLEFKEEMKGKEREGHSFPSKSSRFWEERIGGELSLDFLSKSFYLLSFPSLNETLQHRFRKKSMDWVETKGVGKRRATFKT